VAIPYFQGKLTSREPQLLGLLLLVAAFLLPSLHPGKMGWITSLIPLPVFYYLVRLGKKEGSQLIRNAIFISGGAALLVGSLPLLIFSLTLVPLGITFSLALFNRASAVETALKGALVLGVIWILFWVVFGFIHATNPYTSLLNEVDKGLTSGFALYQENAELPPETLEAIKAAVDLMRVYVPKVLPSLLISVVLCTTWLNLALGNWLLKSKDANLTPWPAYKDWQLPDRLVWGVIIGGALLILLPAPLSTIGLNIIFICGTMFFFQGLAIVSSFLFKWSVPRPIRFLIYGLIFIQTYGIILLSFLGLADVWADFRKLNQVNDNHAGTV
jgi:uncharacterized protein YybS (DUF2232 family)